MGHVPLVATKRRAAIVAQSGGIGFAIKHRAKALGVAISYCVSAGNESDLGAGEFLDYMVQDASTDVILLFIEGIRDVDKFLAHLVRVPVGGGLGIDATQYLNHARIGGIGLRHIAFQHGCRHSVATSRQEAQELVVKARRLEICLQRRPELLVVGKDIEHL